MEFLEEMLENPILLEKFVTI